MKGLGVIFGILALIALVVLVMPLLTQWAWAHSITSVFAIREITWVEAFAFNALGTMLFRSSGLKYNGKNK